MEDMFFGASPKIFERAKMLRNNLTTEEQIFWNVTKGNQLGLKFRRQHPMATYVVDFYAHAIKLVVEIDGENHKNTDYQKADILRDSHLENLGIKVLRFTNNEVNTKLPDVLERLKKVISERKLIFQE